MNSPSKIVLSWLKKLLNRILDYSWPFEMWSYFPLTYQSLEETVNIASDALFANKPKINNFSRNDFDKLLRMALQNNFFNLAVKLLNKLGVAIG